MDQASRSPQAGAAKSLSLLELPQAVLADIISLSAPSYKRQHPLLAVCRAARDAVLQTLRELTVYDDGRARSIPPSAELLHRACCAARPGLSIILHCQSACASALLQRGVRHGGWDRVHTLGFNARYLFPERRSSCLAPELLHSAFPALHTLLLTDIDLGDGALLIALPRTHPQLQSLTLCCCSVDGPAIEPCAAALSCLRHLIALKGSWPGGLELARQVTGLTSLEVHLGDIPAPVVQLAVRNQALRHFKHDSLDTSGTVIAKAQILRDLLMGCTDLTDLELQDVLVTCESLDALLTHGTHITSLTVGNFVLAEHDSRADRPCSWRSLNITGSANILQFALLPLHGIQALALTSYPSDCLQLELPGGMEAAQITAVLSRAATNLAACPAWRTGQVPRKNLYLGYGNWVGRSTPPLGAPWSPHHRLQLLTALAPLAGQTQSLDLDCLDLQLGGAEVMALAHVFGTRLKSLCLTSGQLLPGFWQALVQALPQLLEVAVLPDVEVGLVELGVFCGMRAAAAPAVPLTLKISSWPHGKALWAGLQRGLGDEQSWVKVEYPPDSSGDSPAVAADPRPDLHPEESDEQLEQ